MYGEKKVPQGKIKHEVAIDIGKKDIMNLVIQARYTILSNSVSELWEEKIYHPINRTRKL